MIRACVCGVCYFAAVFSFAFILGTGRTLVLAPMLGPTLAVMIEVPVVLAFSWIVAAWLLRRQTLGLGQCLIMGTSALFLTLGSEVVLAGLLRGQSPDDWARSLLTPLGLLGLGSQVAFALVPLAVKWRQDPHP